MPVTLELIQKGLDQIQTKMATKTEVIELIDQKIAEDKEAQQAQITQVEENSKQAVTELQVFTEKLVEQVKLLKQTRFAAIKTPDGMYNGNWGSLETAKIAGLYVLANVYGNKKAKSQLEARGIELKQVEEKEDKAMGEDVGTTGGILVPAELIPNLILLIEKYGTFRRNTLEYPMAGDSALAPKLTSGLTVYCPGAGVAPSLSDLEFGGVGMNAKKWMTLAAIDSELDEDAAVAIGEIVGFLIGQAFAKQEDLVGFLGDGTSTDIGLGSIAEGTAPKVEECDTTGGSYTDVSGAALADAIADDEDGKLFAIDIDLTKSHKRYMQWNALHAGDGTNGVNACAIAILSRPDGNSPANAAGMGLTEHVVA